MSQINLTWIAATPQPGTSIARYIIYRNDSGNWPPVGSSPVTSFVDTAVLPLSSYTYYVVAIDSRGAVSAQSNQVTIVASGPLPVAVTGLAVSGTTSTTVTLSWNALAGDTYTLYRNGVDVASGLATSTTTDTGLNPSTTYSYTVSATNAVGEGPRSTAVNATTSAVVTSGVVWAPTHIARTSAGNYAIPTGTGNTGNSGELQTLFNGMDRVVAADKNNVFGLFCFVMPWAYFEGPTRGDYTGVWGTNRGTVLLDQLDAKCKSYNPPRGWMLSVNQTGNGAGANTNTAFPSNFAPAYLGVGGSNNAFGGGAEWGGRTGYTNYPNTNTTFWNVNTATALADAIKFIANRYPYTPATGGLALVELTNEMSLRAPGDPPPVSQLNQAALVDAIINGYGTIRTGANANNNVLLCMRPTYVHPSTPAAYTQIINAMRGAKILMANEDGSNNFRYKGNATSNPRVAWCDNAYAGLDPATGVRDLSMTDYTSNTLWGFVFNVENAELGTESNPSKAVPPAGVGSGYYIDHPTFSGVMGGASDIQASFIITFLGTQIGPNCNRFDHSDTATTTPLNPAGGPGAGLRSAKPTLVSVISGVVADDPTGFITGPIAIPRATKPTGW